MIRAELDRLMAHNSAVAIQDQRMVRTKGRHNSGERLVPLAWNSEMPKYVDCVSYYVTDRGDVETHCCRRESRNLVDTYTTVATLLVDADETKQEFKRKATLLPTLDRRKDGVGTYQALRDDANAVCDQVADLLRERGIPFAGLDLNLYSQTMTLTIALKVEHVLALLNNTKAAQDA